jgi:hypothetical protein
VVCCWGRNSCAAVDQGQRSSATAGQSPGSSSLPFSAGGFCHNAARPCPLPHPLATRRARTRMLAARLPVPPPTSTIASGWSDSQVWRRSSRMYLAMVRPNQGRNTSAGVSQSTYGRSSQGGGGGGRRQGLGVGRWGGGSHEAAARTPRAGGGVRVRERRRARGFGRAAAATGPGPLAVPLAGASCRARPSAPSYPAASVAPDSESASIRRAPL